MSPTDTADVPTIEVERFAQEVVVESWEAFKTDPVLYILGYLALWLLGVFSLSIMFGPLTVGFLLIVQRRRRGQAARASDFFGTSQFFSALIVFVVVGAAVFWIGYGLGAIAFGRGLSLFALPVFALPGLLVLFVSCFAFHEIAYRKTGAVEALQGSFRIVKRSALHVLVLLVGVAALNAVGGAAVFGTLLTAPFGMLMMSVAYEKLSGQTPGSAVALDVP